MHRFILITAMFVLAIMPATAQENGDDTNGDGKPDRWLEISGQTISEVSIDRNYDGVVDYIIRYDENGDKKEEILDFNYDGKMDDFYMYARGKMKRREIDTNYDEKIDIWVYLDGIYIEKYEKDTDFDGKIDITEDYTGE